MHGPSNPPFTWTVRATRCRRSATPAIAASRRRCEATRTVKLDTALHALVVIDDVVGDADHELAVRYTLPPGAELQALERRRPAWW